VFKKLPRRVAKSAQQIFNNVLLLVVPSILVAADYVATEFKFNGDADAAVTRIRVLLSPRSKGASPRTKKENENLVYPEYLLVDINDFHPFLKSRLL